MPPLISPITNRRRTVTKRSRSTPVADQNGNLTPLHFQILQWVESRGPGDKRPQIEGLSAFSLDTAVAELILLDLLKAVSLPQRHHDRAHWEPTGLTTKGWRTLMKNRRTKPQSITYPWWRVRTWG